MFRQSRAQLRQSLGVQLTLGIHARQRPTAQAHLGRLEAIPAPVQAAQLFLDGFIGGLYLESALHVVDGILQIALILADHTHAHMGDEVIRNR